MQTVKFSHQQKSIINFNRQIIIHNFYKLPPGSATMTV